MNIERTKSAELPRRPCEIMGSQVRSNRLGSNFKKDKYGICLPIGILIYQVEPSAVIQF